MCESENKKCCCEAETTEQTCACSEGSECCCGEECSCGEGCSCECDCEEEQLLNTILFYYVKINAKESLSTLGVGGLLMELPCEFETSYGDFPVILKIMGV